MRIKIKAFGCKLNQAEAGAIECSLAAAGHDIVGRPPYDVVVVCGCTVTVRADYKVRQYFRRMKRDHGGERMILSGCSAVSFTDDVVGELEIEKIFAKNDPEALVEYLGRLTSQKSEKLTFAGRTRGFVKIQDGCNQFCTYCIVPYVRGRERSVPPDAVLERVCELETADIKEVVLTGVHDGRYRADGLDLAALCKKLLDKTNIERIRLSSVEVLEINDSLIELLATENRMAPHLHVPLQSGSDAVLERMGRRYTSEEYAAIIGKLAQKVDDIGIGADVIVGFPGETDEEFDRTYRLIESLPITYLHIFRYSPRPGTAAADMSEQVHNETKWERMKILKKLDENLRERFARSQFGKPQRVIVERVEDKNGFGWTGNYLRAAFAIDSNKRNEMVTLKPISYKNKIINCKIIEY